jgi:CO/xanthine dehydrogenase FAD-binding subunit
MQVLRPASIDETLRLLAERGAAARILAGGTDLVVRMKEALETPATLVSLAGCPGLAGVREEDGAIVVGAMTTHEDLSRDPLLRRLAPVLCDGAADVGSVQIRRRGTLGGNLANASPSADAVPPLHVLDAVLRIRSKDGTRDVPVGAFATGPKQNVLRPGELLVEIRFPRPAEREVQGWVKVGQRAALACAKLSLALRARLDGGVLRDVRIALGGVAPTVVRAARAEAALEGKRPEAAVVAASQVALQNDIRPIDDVRSDAAYRLEAAAVILGRALAKGLARAAG